MSPAVEVMGLTKRFPRDVGYGGLVRPWRRSFKVGLEGVNLRLDRGQVLGLLGPNGAGKTTLLKVLATLLLPNAGQVKVHGYDVVRQAKAVKRLVAYVVSEERSFYWRLTGRQNLRFFGALNNVHGHALEARLVELAEVLSLGQDLDTRVAYYSTGMRQKLAIARALLREPSLILLDEPSRGLDPLTRQHLHHLVWGRLVAQEGGTVILATHNLDEARQLCDSVALLDKGRVIAAGPPSSLFSGPDFARQVTVEAQHLGPTALSALASLPGVLRVMPRAAVNGNGACAVDLSLDDPEHRLPAVLESLQKAGGKVIYCRPKDPTPSELLTHLLQRYG